MFKVKLKTNSDTLEFTANGQNSLMECAQEFEINIPSSCRNGTCRTCMTRSKSGVVRYDIGWPGLSQEEKLEGWILPCVAIACSDLELENTKAYQI